jgi:hypothetical protein
MLVSLLFLATIASPPQPRASGAVSSVRVRSDAWRQMSVDVQYALANTPRATMSLRWMRKNGRLLAYPAASSAVSADSQSVSLSSTYKSMLPPPSQIVLHVELRAPSGALLAQRDCDLVLVTPNGKPAWAADVAAGKPMRWIARRCEAR